MKGLALLLAVSAAAQGDQAVPLGFINRMQSGALNASVRASVFATMSDCVASGIGWSVLSGRTFVAWGHGIDQYGYWWQVGQSLVWFTLVPVGNDTTVMPAPYVEGFNEVYSMPPMLLMPTWTEPPQFTNPGWDFWSPQPWLIPALGWDPRFIEVTVPASGVLAGEVFTLQVHSLSLVTGEVKASDEVLFGVQ